MRIIKTDSYEEMSRKTAELIAAQVVIKPNCVLGLATGSSPVGAYKRLIEMNKNGTVDFSEVKTVNLDEYIGLSASHPQGYRFFMQDNLFDHINIKPENTNVPSGIAEDMQAECKRYDDLITSLGGIDLQLLGIGLDGHIGFNEPCDHFDTGTHTVVLDESTINANARFFNSIDEVPTKAVTMGIRSIMTAKKIVLIANGKNKMEILDKAINGPVTPLVPASALQLHPDVTVIYSEV